MKFKYLLNEANEFGSIIKYNLKTLGIEGTDEFDMANHVVNGTFEKRIEKKKMNKVVFGDSCAKLFEEAWNRKSQFYHTLDTYGSCCDVIVYTDNSYDSIGISSKKINVMFYNENSSVAEFVKSLSVKPLTKNDFIKIVKEDGEIRINDDSEKRCFRVIKYEGKYYGACCRIDYDDNFVIDAAKSMEWIGDDVEEVCIAALKERDVSLLRRANEYLVSIA